MPKTSWTRNQYYVTIIDDHRVSIGYHDSNPHAAGGTIWTFENILNNSFDQNTIKEYVGEKALKQLLNHIQKEMGK